MKARKSGLFALQCCNIFNLFHKIVLLHLKNKKMKIKISFVVGFILSITVCYGQSTNQLNGFLQERYAKTVAKTETIIKENFKNSLDGSSYLLYNIDDKYIIIVDESCCYRQYFIKEGLGIQKSIDIKKKNKVLKRAFDLSSYNEDFVSVKSDSVYQNYNIHSKFIYFFIKSKGLKYGEFYLPILFNVKVDDKKLYPINERVHKFLMEQFITYWLND